MPPVLLFLLQGLMLITAPYLLWAATPLRRLVPLVVVQILAGVLLGPSGLGAVAPAAFALAFPPASLALLTGLSWLAVVVFAFVTALHLDFAEIAAGGGRLLLVGASALLVPAVLGTAAGYWVAAAYPAMRGGQAGSPGLFAVAFGMAIAVTALPVLGAILRDMALLGSRIGHLALGYATIGDAALWLLLAALLGQQAAAGPSAAALLTLAGGGVAYLLVMLLAVRPALARLVARLAVAAADPGGGGAGDGVLVAVTAVLLGSAAATEAMGLHYLLGAVVAGVIVPRPVAQQVKQRLEPFAVVVLLPFFFTLTGLRLDLTRTGDGLAAVFLAATVAGMAGKFAGTALAARWAGEPWAVALPLGTLMQCKGLMEVIVLTVLLDAGLLSVPCFSALVLMALATTAATKPLTLLALRRR